MPAIGWVVASDYIIDTYICYGNNYWISKAVSSCLQLHTFGKAVTRSIVRHHCVYWYIYNDYNLLSTVA